MQDFSDAPFSIVAAGTTGTYSLTVTKTGAGSGTVSSSPSGISNCSGTCSANYNSGTSVTLTATPTSGSYFSAWSGDCSGTGTCTVSMTSAKNVTAAFNTSGGPTLVTVTSPNGGETWKVGETHAITWSASGVSSSNSIRISLNGMVITTVAGANSGTYNWTIPSTLQNTTLGAGNVYKIYLDVSSGGIAVATGSSDNFFSIATSGGNPLSLAVLSPNGNETWAIGETHAIKWSAPGYSASTNVKLSLVIPPVWPSTTTRTSTIVTTQNSGSYNWVVPSSAKTYFDNQCSPCPSALTCNCGKFKIRADVLNSSGQTAVSDDSDNTFTVEEGATPEVTVSVNPTTIKKNDMLNVSWSSNLQSCRIWLSCGDNAINNLPTASSHNFGVYCNPGTYTFAARCFSQEVMNKYGDTTNIPDSQGTGASTSVIVTQ